MFEHRGDFGVRFGLFASLFLLAACEQSSLPSVVATQAESQQVPSGGQPVPNSTATPPSVVGQGGDGADSAARAAWSQAYAAWAAVLLAFLGLAATAVAALYARGAYVQAKRQADAADKAWFFFEPLPSVPIITPEGEEFDERTRQQTFKYGTAFQITNHGKVPGRIIAVAVHIFAQIDRKAEGMPFDKSGKVKAGYVEVNDGGSVNYELENTIVAAGKSVTTKYSKAAFRVSRPLPASQDRIGLRTIYLWLRVTYSDPGSDDREVGHLFEIPFAGRVRVLYGQRKHTYRR